MTRLGFRLLLVSTVGVLLALWCVPASGDVPTISYDKDIMERVLKHFEKDEPVVRPNSAQKYVVYIPVACGASKPKDPPPVPWDPVWKHVDDFFNAGLNHSVDPRWEAVISRPESTVGTADSTQVRNCNPFGLQVIETDANGRPWVNIFHLFDHLGGSGPNNATRNFGPR
jgi:hypothetical protein